ncbi:MAG: hypothetical protein WCG83_00355 [Candidatus Peregrinibacteria bacterium]
MDIRKNSTLIIGLLIPVLMIVFVAGSIYIPGLFAPAPTYNFLYTSSNDYNYNWTVEVRGDKLVRLNRDAPKDSNLLDAEPAIYLFDVATRKSRIITLAEAQKLKLNPNAESPDGYQVNQSSNGGGFPFGFNNESRLYMRGHSTSFRIDVNIDNGYWNFRFLGWVIPQ